MKKEIINSNDFDLTEYLNVAQQLESSVYRQEKAIEEINRRIEENNWSSASKEKERYYNLVDELNKLKNKENKYIGPYSPEYVSIPETITKLDSSARKNAQITFSLAAMVFVFSCISADTLPGLVIVSFLVMIVALFIDIILKLTEKKRIKKINDEKLAFYERQKKRAEEKYNREKAAAEKRHEELIVEKQHEVDLAKDLVKSLMEESELKNKLARRERKKLEDTLSKSKNVLKQLYDSDIVYPKYRNMAAMCTMYEYLASGRCDKLEGPDGAYNLYETEIRQNVIVVSLAKIIQQLEDIKDRQYQLYQELKTTNRMLNNVGNEMNAIYNTTSSIEQIAENIESNSYISNQCTEIISKNTNALKYITLINSAHNW